MRTALPVFSVFFVAFALWSASALLSNHLAGGQASGRTGERGAPSRNEAGEQAGGASSVMAQLESYAARIKQNPSDSDALLAIGRICIDSGLYDKAAEYYERYLVLKPEDTKAQVDYSLALVQSGRAEKAIEKLKEVLTKEPELFPAQLSLALAFRVAGRKEEARAQALVARTHAPDQAGANAIDDFLASLDAKSVENGADSAQAAAKPEELGKLSPAGLLDSYFRNHSIIGPKLVAITWPEATSCRVAVKDFPVEQMPPFAREKFLKNAAEALSALPQKITVVLADAQDGRELISFQAGGTRTTP